MYMYMLIMHNVHVHVHVNNTNIHDVIRDVERKKERKTPEAMEK